jgi:hypothetical protein
MRSFVKWKKPAEENKQILPNDWMKYLEKGIMPSIKKKKLGEKMKGMLSKSVEL